VRALGNHTPAALRPSSRAGGACTAVVALAMLGACGGGMPHSVAAPSLADLRSNARGSGDGEEVGRWALAEMLAPGGTAEQATAARQRLASLPHQGMWAGLARATADEVHGDPASAAESYLVSLRATVSSTDERAPLVGWYAVRHLLGLRASVTDLYTQHRDAFEALLTHPGHAGWRAVAELEDWRAIEVYDRAERTGDAYDAEVVKRMGCARGMRLAGPFGHGPTGSARSRRSSAHRGPWRGRRIRCAGACRMS